jgi:hypothetical protein
MYPQKPYLKKMYSQKLFAAIRAKTSFLRTTERGRELSTRGFGDTDWTDGFARPWDVSVASFEAIETDLDELIDPDGLESALAIDDQGNFLAWMDSERGMAPMPLEPSEFEAPVAMDLNAAAPAPAGNSNSKIGPNGFKRFVPPSSPEANVPALSSEAIDAVLAELEASAQTEPESTSENLEVDAQADTDENSVEAKKPKIDPMALEDAFESVPFDSPELMGESMEAQSEVEIDAQAEVETEVVESEIEAQAEMLEVEAEVEMLEIEAEAQTQIEAQAEIEAEVEIEAQAEMDTEIEAQADTEIEAQADSDHGSDDNSDEDESVQAKKPKIDPMALEDAFESVPFDAAMLTGDQTPGLVVEAQAEVEAEAVVIPEGEPVEPVAAWKKPAKAKKKQPSEFGIDEVALEAMLEVASNEDDDGNTAEAEAVTSDLQPEAEALAAVGLGEANLEEGILAAYEMDGVPMVSMADLSKAAELINPVLINPAPVAEPVNAGFAAHHDSDQGASEIETPESVLDSLQTSALGFESPEIQPLDAELETDSSVAAVLAPEIMNVPMMPATTTLRRHFDATDLIEAQIRLRHALRPLEVTMASLVGRAAQRCALELPGIKSVVLAELAENGIEITAHIKAVESFREVLAGISEGAEGANGIRGDLSVVDISDLGLDEVVLPLSGPHLLLTRLASHPDKPGRMVGTVSLSGLVNLRAGAAFLDQVVSKLEAPITLMV